MHCRECIIHMFKRTSCIFNILKAPVAVCRAPAPAQGCSCRYQRTANVSPTIPQIWEKDHLAGERQETC